MKRLTTCGGVLVPPFKDMDLFGLEQGQGLRAPNKMNGRRRHGDASGLFHQQLSGR